jgi:hypothetical protein
VTDANSCCWDGHCNGCPNDQGPANGCYWPSQVAGDCFHWFWSSTAIGNVPGDEWVVGFWGGYLDYDAATGDEIVRCVRL